MPPASKVIVDGVKGGSDSFGNVYESTAEMWQKELGKANPTSKKGWYGKAVHYWDGVDATVDGVLGGFGHVSGVDLKESQEFLTSLKNDGHLKLSEESRAVDCGAGIGRITEGLLCKMFSKVDLVEPVVKLLKQGEDKLKGMPTVGDFHYVGLQDFTPEKGMYDVIWVQWVIGHLTDDDCVAFFTRCRRGLKEGGVICLKENVCKDGFVVDKDDSSVTRSDVYLQGLFREAGMEILSMTFQLDFPKELFAVRMFAVR
mmetsp:Transcript_20749/g.50349  ORF Transcript_20749/g.50349 Transcript_20749/m.50349 type:complete len:257 (-) Transcript_20749:253-1023(-)